MEYETIKFYLIDRYDVYMQETLQIISRMTIKANKSRFQCSF